MAKYHSEVSNLHLENVKSEKCAFASPYL